MNTATYKIYVDWDADGNFTGAYDDVSAYVLSASWEYGSDSLEPGNGKAGSCRVRLDNSTSIFSSLYSLSPIYNKILPGRRVKVTMTIAPAAAVTMWQGYLQSIDPVVGEVVEVSTAELVAYGILAQLESDETVDIAMQESVTTGAAIDAILDAAGIAASDASLDTGQSTLSRFWARKGRTLSLIRELEAAETGLIRETKDGKIQFEDRAHRLSAPHTTARSTYGTGTLNLWDVVQGNGLAGIYNAVEVPVRTFNLSDTDTLVTLVDVENGKGGEPIAIAASPGTKTVTIEFPTPNSPSEYLAVDDWGIVTYEVNTAADGTGTDITASVSAVATENGRSLTLAFTNASASAGYFVKLLVAGVAVVEGDPIIIKDSDATSQTKYRKRSFPIPSQWCTAVDEAEGYCDHILALYKNPREPLRFQIKANYDATHLLEAQTIDVSDRIHVEASAADFSLGIDADFFVEWVRHSIAGSPTLHTVDVFAVRAVTDSWAATAPSVTPLTVPDGVPDDLEVGSIDPDLHCTFGCVAWKYNENITGARFRAKWFATKQQDAVDLRTVAEGGTLVDDMPSASQSQTPSASVSQTPSSTPSTSSSISSSQSASASPSASPSAESVSASSSTSASQSQTASASSSTSASPSQTPSGPSSSASASASATPSEEPLIFTGIIDDDVYANYLGAQYEFDSPQEGYWYFAFQFKSKAGDSVWSDGNKTPRYVTDYLATDTGAASGPPQDWWVEVDPDPVNHRVKVRASRPKINGQKIWCWRVQIKDVSSDHEWYPITYDYVGYPNTEIHFPEIGYPLPETFGPGMALTLDNRRFTRETGTGLVGPHADDEIRIGDLILFDRRGGGAFNRDYCQWGTVDTIQGVRSTPTHAQALTMTYFDVVGRFHTTVTSDLRVVVVRGPWEWTDFGFLGAQPNNGMWSQDFWSNGQHGDKDTRIFESDWIDVPDNVALSDIEARVWFDNGYSVSDDNMTHSTGIAADGGNPSGASGLVVLTHDDDAAIPSGQVAFQFNRDTANYKSIYCVAIVLSRALPAEGPYDVERDAAPGTVLESGTCIVAAGDKAITVTRSANSAVVGKVFAIYTNDATPDSDLDGNVIASESANSIVLTAPFNKSGSFSYAILKCWWDQAQTNNLAYYQFTTAQCTPDVEKTVWRTTTVPAPDGGFYATGYSRNEYGVGTRMTSAQASAGADAVPLTPAAGAVSTDVALGNFFTVATGGSAITLNNPTGTFKSGHVLIWCITGAGAITLGDKFNARGASLTRSSSGRDYLGAIYNATADKWDVWWSADSP